MDGDTIALGDTKTDPTTLYLNARARRIIERQPLGRSPFVLLSPRNPEPPHDPDLPLCDRIRKEAGMEDVRLHNLRHTMVSHAVMNGVPAPVVSRWIGHSNVRLTLRYAYLANKDIEAAARRVGAAMARVMALEYPHTGRLSGPTIAYNRFEVVTPDPVSGAPAHRPKHDPPPGSSVP